MTAKNVIIFVADGLRNGSINPTDTPTLYSIRQQGVNFANSHSLFPTFTTPNASAIATGHYLGDTGDFSNTIYSGFPVPNANGSVTPFIESDPVLGDIDEKFPGNNFLDEESLLSYARANGYNTAAIGKLGPVAIQDVTQDNRVGGVTGTIPTPKTIIIDDNTNGTNPPKTPVGSPSAVPLDPDVANRLIAAGLGTQTTARVQPSGTNTTPGTTIANVAQQQYFADATTKVVLPKFKDEGKPFAMVYWSRDPDGSQHNQGDSLNTLTPGINGPTSKAGVKNADDNLKQILDYLKATGLDQTTDVFVTADHGFSTISKQPIDNQGTKTNSYAATQTYAGVNAGFLPPGFVAIDLAKDLNLPLYDPDSNLTPPADINNVQYTQVDATKGQRPRNGNGVIGGTGKVTNGKTDGQVVVAANGGSDLIYLPTGDKTLAQQVVNFLSQKDYISGIFVDDSYGSIAGALPLSSIGLKGDAKTPVPAIVINFKTFFTDANNPVNTEVEIADSALQQGQGMHGSFGRGDTFNNMAAIGPDFKQGYVDYAPVSNADVTPTLARILGLQLPSSGNLKGRAISEALVGGPDQVAFTTGTITSQPAANGQATTLNYQDVNGVRYFTTAGFAGRTVGLTTATPKITQGANNSLALDNGFGSLVFTKSGNAINNEFGVFFVDDDKGTINGIAAGNTKEYIQAALKRSQILFAALPNDSVLQVDKQSTQRVLSFPQSARLGFYTISNNTSNKVRSDLASGVAVNNTASVLFNFATANPNGSNRFTVNNLGNSGYQVSFDNNSVITVQTQASNTQASTDAGAINLLIDPGQLGDKTAISLGVKSEAAYNDFVGYYRVANAKGDVVVNGQTFKPGDAGYAQAAMQQALQGVGSNNGDLTGSGYIRGAKSTDTSLSSGSLLAPFLITNGDIQSFLAKNGGNDPNNGGAKDGKNPLAYFAFVNANPDKVDHIRGIGGNKIGFEDLFGGGDQDFNDVIMQITSSKPLVTAAVAFG